MSDLIDELRGFSKAYPEDMFPPFTDEERTAYSVVISRASGAMGRHCAKHMARAADEIERLTAVAQHAEICVEAYRARIKTLTAERDELRRQPAAAAPAAPQAGPKREPNPDEVICPACTHQFRAIQKERGTTSSANSRRRQHD